MGEGAVWGSPPQCVGTKRGREGVNAPARCVAQRTDRTMVSSMPHPYHVLRASNPARLLDGGVSHAIYLRRQHFCACPLTRRSVSEWGSVRTGVVQARAPTHYGTRVRQPGCGVSRCRACAIISSEYVTSVTRRLSCHACAQARGAQVGGSCAGAWPHSAGCPSSAHQGPGMNQASAHAAF